MVERFEVRLAGSGSHGMIQAGLILQEAAAIYDDKNAHHVQSYGPEARGNAARSEVLISDGDIDYPKATRVDVLLATTDEAVEKYTHDLKPGALVIVDESVRAKVPEGSKTYVLPLLKTAEKDLGRPTLLHVVALGVVVGLSKIVTNGAIEAAVKDHAARGSEPVHLGALEAGYTLAANAKKS
ncbi:MAG: 2-oxoacid:acceptor oxidoreductase family protein [Deltaproteobacteria bacterium]|nr:2-oxoacid:acceptor oxidoreductase family protein [Deltaproteobacteria bacterium]